MIPRIQRLSGPGVELLKVGQELRDEGETPFKVTEKGTSLNEGKIARICFSFYGCEHCSSTICVFLPSDAKK